MTKGELIAEKRTRACRAEEFQILLYEHLKQNAVLLARLNLYEKDTKDHGRKEGFCWGLNWALQNFNDHFSVQLDEAA